MRNAIESNEVANQISEILMGEDAAEVLPAVGIMSFKAAGVLTRDDGFVLRLEDGSEFQITVVKSR